MLTTYCLPPVIVYAHGEDLFNALWRAFEDNTHVDFSESYKLPYDPLVSDKERVRMAIYDIWKVTGYHSHEYICTGETFTTY